MEGGKEDILKVSVIVPVYNVEPYLPVCMDSILAQTLKEIEIICVDDGSTDGSGAILDGYAMKDSRVRVFHRENGGYGKAVNAGIDAARGEYIGIVESDDKILPSMYEKLYRAAREHGLDLAKSDCIFWWEAMDYAYEHHKEYLEPFYGRVLDASCRRTFFLFLMNIWSGIYKREFLEKCQIRCNETAGASYQDNGFWMQTMCLAERAMWLKEAFYLYRQDNPSSSIKSKAKATAMMGEYDFAERMLEQKSGQYEMDLCHYYRMIRHKGVFFRISDQLKREYSRHIVCDFEKYGHLTVENKEVHGWLTRLYDDPDGFCREFISRKTGTLRRLEKAENIIIYGAGNYGQRALRILSYQNLCQKVLCFAVSDEKAEGNIGRIPVRCIDQLYRYRDQAAVIIGASRHTAAYGQIEARLKETGFGNVLDTNLLSDYFYYLK